MPTLVSKAAFSLPADSAKAKALGRNKVEGHLQPAAPPRNLQEVRAAVSKSIASVTRKLARLERDYYVKEFHVLYFYKILHLKIFNDILV